MSFPDSLAPLTRNSKNAFQTLALNDVEQLAGRSIGMLVTHLPLPYRGQAGVEHGSQHRLAQTQAFTQRLDALGVIGRYRRQAQGIISGHLALVDESQPFKVACCLVNGLKDGLGRHRALLLDLLQQLLGDAGQLGGVGPGGLGGLSAWHTSSSCQTSWYALTHRIPDRLNHLKGQRS